MKKLLVLMMVLGIASAANASLLISVDGVVDSDVEIAPSTYVTIDVFSDGQTIADTEVYMMIIGPATLDISAGTVYGELGVPIEKLIDLGDGLYYIDLVIPAAPVVPPIPEGVVVDLITFHCEGPEDVTILLGSTPGGSEFDTQVIVQPEPMTIALLGLGGLFLRRRK